MSDWPRGEGWRASLPRPTRRALLIGGGAGAGLAVAWVVWPRTASVDLNLRSGERAFGSMLTIGRNGVVTVYVPQTELGQGVQTMAAQIAADELGADWRTMAVMPAPVSSAYTNHVWLDADAEVETPRWFVPRGFGGWRRRMVLQRTPAMITSGGTSRALIEPMLREAAANARWMMSEVAAEAWGVNPAEVEARDGFVVLGRRRRPFAELAEAAAERTAPAMAPLRAPTSRPLMGRALPRLELPSRIDGSALFAGDIRLPNMVYAAIRQGPLGDARLVSHDEAAVRGMPGVAGVVAHERWVAVAADTHWTASHALDAMRPHFSVPRPAADDRLAAVRLRRAAREGAGARISGHGDVEDAFRGRTVLGSEFVVQPALRQPLELPSATAEPLPEGVRLWVASQAPGFARAAVARALGLSQAAVQLIVTPGGGGFDVNLDSDVAVQAALIARALNRPVQLCWSRAEALLRDRPRAPTRIRMAATLSAGATIDAMHARAAAPGARREQRARWDGVDDEPSLAEERSQLDAQAVAGLAPPYRIPHLAVDHVPVDTGMPTGSLRGGAAAGNVFALESFVDELARAGGSDPMLFRMSMLGDAPLLAACLEIASALAGWDGGMAGSGMGIACASFNGAHIAVVAKCALAGSAVRVDRLVAAVDVGPVVNPTLAQQQIEGGLLFGLAHAVGYTSAWRGGVVAARRLRELGPVTLASAPAISVELIASPRDPAPYAEIAMLPVAPAIANALASLEGRRRRRLPLSARPVE